MSTAPVITTTSLPSGTVGTPYTASLASTNLLGTPLTWSLAANSSPLPAGLSLASNGVISGIPTSAGIVGGLFFTLNAGTNLTATSQPLSITINSGRSTLDIIVFILLCIFVLFIIIAIIYVIYRGMNPVSSSTLPATTPPPIVSSTYPPTYSPTSIESSVPVYPY